MRKPASHPGKSNRKNIPHLWGMVTILLFCFVLLASTYVPAMASQAVVPAADATGRQDSNILFQENFDDGSAQGFGNDAGAWKVVNGKYTGTTGTFRFSTAGDLSWQNYVLQADFVNAHDGGLLVRTQDYNNTITLVIRATYDDIGWNIRKGGNWGDGLNTVKLGHQPGENLSVKIEVTGTQLKSYINGELKTSLETSEFPKGKIGLYLFSSAEQYWDNVVVSTGGTTATTTTATTTAAVTNTPAPTTTVSGLIYQATLKNGDYGGGTAVTPTSGVVNSPSGVSYVSTESNKQSSGLVNWEIPANRRVQFCSQGTVSFMFKADRQSFVNGSILADNYGYDQYHNGQSTFSVAAYRITNGTGTDDDQLFINWSTWHKGTWLNHPPNGQATIVLEFDKWYYLGFAWGGPSNIFEIWVSGELKENDSQAGAALPWGSQSMGTGSGTNIGLGSNHERGVSNYGSAAGVTFASIRIWDQYKANGDTQPVSNTESSPTTTATTTITTTPTSTPGVTSTGAAALTFESRSGTSSSTVQVPLSLKGVQDKIGNIDVSLTFDASVIKAVEVNKGSLTANSIFDSNIQNDTIKISLADNQGFDGDGTIAYISFKAIGGEGASSALHIAGVAANRAADSSPMTLSTRDGTFSVVSVTELRKHLTVLDALRALKMAVGKLTIDTALDVNSDGEVTSADARLILQMAVGNTPETASTTTSAGSSSQVMATGTATKIASQTVTADGGTIVIHKTNDPLDGLTIVIPQGAYETPVEFTISESPVLQLNTAHQAKALSPLITIDNGGVYARELIEVKIPVKVPADQYAMGFIYDQATQGFEGLPAVAEDDASITIITSHFCEIVVTGYEKSLVDHFSLREDTKFVPGVDTWNLPNTGSYICQGGFSRGITLSEIYYFLKEKPVTGKPLWQAEYSNGLPDDMPTPGFWEDDSLAIQLCSECDYLMSGQMMRQYLEDFKKKLGQGWSTSDQTYRQTVFSILLTGEPQLLNLYSSEAREERTIICYGVDGDQLLVADPNYPDRRDLSIIYDLSNDEFHPYLEADSVMDAVAGKTVKYDVIRYAGFASFYDIPSLRSLWAEYNSGSINTSFPHYDIWVNELDDAGNSVSRYGVELANDKTITAKSIKIETAAKEFSPYLNIYRYGDFDNPLYSDTVELQPGDNYLGLSISGSYPTGLSWAGFDWVKITLNAASSTAIQATSIQGPAIIFSTVTGETDYWDTLQAGTIAINIQPSGKVTGTWSGQTKRNDLFYDFSSNLTGQLTLSQNNGNVVEATGTYTITEHTASNSFNKTFTGTMRLYFEVSFLPTLRIDNVIDIMDQNQNVSIGQWTPSS